MQPLSIATVSVAWLAVVLCAALVGVSGQSFRNSPVRTDASTALLALSSLLLVGVVVSAAVVTADAVQRAPVE